MAIFVVYSFFDPPKRYRTQYFNLRIIYRVIIVVLCSSPIQKAPTHQNEQRLIQQQQLEQSRQRHCDTSPYDWEAEQQQPSLSAPEAASKRRRGKRRRLIGGGVDQAELREGEGEQDGGSPDMADSPEERVHPSLKKFHWTVIKMVDEADELIFRRIVSYL